MTVISPAEGRNWEPLQTSDAENEHNVNFLFPGKRQAGQLRQWQQNGGNIECDIDARTHGGYNVETNTVTRMLVIPALPGQRYWRTLENDGGKEGQPVAHRYGDGDVDPFLEGGRGEYAKEEEHDGDSNKRDGDNVEDLIQPKSLG